MKPKNWVLGETLVTINKMLPNNISDQFPMLSTDVQFLQIMSNPQYYRSASRAMHNILNRRRCNMLR